MKRTILSGVLISLISLSAIAEVPKQLEYDINFYNNNAHKGLKVSPKDIKNITVPPVQTKEEIFSECIMQSDQILKVMDVLKVLPEDQRAKELYNSQIWATLSEDYQNNLLKFLASLSSITDTKYKIIKGEMADGFKKECLAVIK
jgi:hypothetical protein